MHQARMGPGPRPKVASENPAEGAFVRSRDASLEQTRAQYPLAPVISPADCRAPAPAGLRAALDARPGAPLPEGVRQSAEARFGRSFAHVRVHADGEAPRMAAVARARAFTLGRHVVFGLGQYRPDTSMGAALMWHELTHVSAAADPAMLLRMPLYRTEDLTFTPPPKGLSEAQLRGQLDAKVKKSPPDITGWSIKGAKPTDEAYIFLEAALFEFGLPDRKNSVSRLSMELGWETSGGAGAAIIPTGLVTITIDSAGFATAELVSPASIALSPSLPSADAVTKLKIDFGIDAVPGDKAWRPVELGDVVQALGLLKGNDRAALKGVQLMRFATLPDRHAGEFSAGGGVAAGATAVQAPPTLKLADSAFPEHRFARGPAGGTPLPGSEQTISHEVGHAVEQAISRAALEKADTAVVGQNAAKKALDVAIGQARKAAGTPGAQKSIDEYTRRRKAYDAAASAATRTKAAHAATLVPTTVLAPLESDVRTRKTVGDAARKGAISAMATANAKDVADSLPYRSAVDAVATAIDDYVSKARPGTELDPLDAALAAARSAREQARASLAKLSPANPALAGFAPVEAAEDDWATAARALGHTRGRTRRLQKFVDLVTTSGIRPLTPYARDSWPDKPEEFYAETYSLWLTEPDFLKTNYPLLFNFFESGDYAN
jgi:hypothetical protein